MRLGLGIGIGIGGSAGPIWTPASEPETFAWFDPSRLTGTENDSVSGLTNLADSLSILPSLTGTNCKLRNISGIPAVWLEATQVARLTGLVSSSVAQPVTIAIVATPDTAFGSNILLGGGPGGATTESRITVTGTTYPRAVTCGAGTALSAGTILQQNQPFIATARLRGGTTSQIYVEQTLKNTGNGGTANFEGFTIGNARALGAAFGGCIGEIVCMRNASDLQVSNLLNYLALKWKTLSGAKRWRVTRLGDSLTAGTGGTTGYGGAGYEIELWSRGAPGGAYLDFIGTTANLSVYSNSHHRGVGGSDTAYHINASTGVDPYFTLGYQPNIFDLYLGTNDANGTNTAYNGTTSANQYAALLAKIRTNWPNARVLVSTIHPITGGGAANVADFNSRLPAIWDAEEALGGKLHRWDMYSALNGTYNAALMSDSLHFNPAGYTVRATTCQSAYLSAIAALG